MKKSSPRDANASLEALVAYGEWLCRKKSTDELASLRDYLIHERTAGDLNIDAAEYLDLYEDFLSEDGRVALSFDELENYRKGMFA